MPHTLINMQTSTTQKNVPFSQDLSTRAARKQLENYIVAERVRLANSPFPYSIRKEVEGYSIDELRMALRSIINACDECGEVCMCCATSSCECLDCKEERDM